jgi:mannose-1-phosphate guanylyltransferase/mannose-6-phosphate isomerase
MSGVLNLPASVQITPILLCGGSGTRLWPISRKTYPKQFVPLLGDETPFQATAKRVASDKFAAPIVITNSDFRFLVTEQLLAVGIDPGAILLEPSARNTAPAVLAALQATDHSADDLFLAVPADHAVPNSDAFQAAVAAGIDRALAGDIITFGIKPDRPETGYGYLEMAEAPAGELIAQRLVRFVEKPDADLAAKMVADSRFLWNAGIFLFSYGAIMQAFQEHAPDLVRLSKTAVANAKVDLGFLRLESESWNSLDSVSIDYAVMEKTSNLAVIPYNDRWSDLGAWDAIWREAEPDSAGVVTLGSATAIDCHSSLLRSESGAIELVGVGLNNIVAVAMNDAVLVADMSRAQDIGAVVEALRKKGAQQADQLPIDHRPWGWFENLVVGQRFQVKRIFVVPGAKLSLQSHFHRSEHWIVVAGTARITIGEESKLLTENESVFIPLGEVHRLENPGHVPVVLIEVQTGVYLGEDDIVRHSDMYARE